MGQDKPIMIIVDSPDDLGEWLSNTYNPHRPDAILRVLGEGNQTQDQAWADHQAWISRNLIGPPKASEQHTVGDLVARGMVGIYRKKTSSSRG